MNTSINDCQLIEIPKIHNVLGSLSVIEGQTIPFQIKSVSHLFDIHENKQILGAYKNQQTFFVALYGSFDLVLKDGSSQQKIKLERPNQGLFVPAGIWIEMQNFLSGSVCLTIASVNANEQDCFCNYSEFELSKNSRHQSDINK